MEYEQKEIHFVYFVREMFGDEVGFWDKAEKIFRVKGLKGSYGGWKNQGRKTAQELVAFILYRLTKLLAGWTKRVINSL